MYKKLYFKSECKSTTFFKKNIKKRLVLRQGVFFVAKKIPFLQMCYKF